LDIRIANFNVENLFSRYSILNMNEELVEKFEAEDYGKLAMAGKTRKGQEWHQLRREPISEEAQKNTARILDLLNADVVCMQEVEDLPTLRDFADKVLWPLQKQTKKCKRYDNFILIDGNDMRGIDVAVMSRYPLGKIETHIYENDKKTNKPLFSRDCLEVDILAENKTVHLMVQHFKSQITSTKNDINGAGKRGRQATRVAQIYNDRKTENQNEYVIVAGDFNDSPQSKPLKPLFDAGLYNTIEDLPASERWTYIHGKTKQQLDYLLVSPNLKSKIKSFGVERRGLSKSKTAYKGPRLGTVQKDGTEASDHCGIYLDLSL
jgi:predicted extracellular nuclease